MSFATDTILPPRHERSWMLWGAAALVIVCAHLALALFFMLRPEPEAIGSNTPEPVLIDLTPLAAPPAENKVETPQPEQQTPPEPKPMPQMQQEEVAPVAVPEPLPEQEAMPQTPALPVPDMPEMPQAEVTLPAPVNVPAPLPKQEPMPQMPLLKMPELPKLPKAEPTLRAKPQPQRELSKRETNREDHRQAQRNERSQMAARTPAEAPSQAASSFAMANWRSELYAHIKRFQHYPDAARSRGEFGTASVVFTLDRAGRVVSARLAGSSGSAVLDQEAVATVRRASPMPAPPSGSATVSVPLRYSLR